MKVSKVLKRTCAAVIGLSIALSGVSITVPAAGPTPEGMISEVYDYNYYVGNTTTGVGTSSLENPKLVGYIADAIMNCQESIDISSYKISTDECQNLMQIVSETHPELFFYSGMYRYSYTGNVVISIKPSYMYVDEQGRPDRDKINSMLKEFYSEADRYLDMVQSDASMYDSDYLKALLLHDEIVLDMRYDYSNHNDYTFMIDKYGVCESYSHIYAYLLGQLGIKSELVVSPMDGNNAGHEWIKLCLDGKWYNIDPTWDDPVLSGNKDNPGRVGHTYFLLSDDLISTMDDSHKNYLSINAANDKKYDNYKLHGYNSKLCKVTKDDTILYAADNVNRRIVKYDYAADKETTVIDLGGYRWQANTYGSFWSSGYISLGEYRGRLFYNTPNKIYCYDPVTGKSDEIFSVESLSQKQFFGLRIKDGKIYGITGQYTYYDINEEYCVDARNFVNSADSVKISKTSAEMDIGDSLVLSYELQPAGAEDDIIWSSSDTSVADINVVDGLAYVSAKKAGTADITVKISNGKTDVCRITVASPLVNDSTISSASITLGNSITIKGAASGGTAPYTYSYYYKKTTDKDWVVKKANTAETSVSFKPGAVKSYSIKVIVKDSKGTSKEKILTVNVTDPNAALVNNSKLSSTSITLGNSITITGAASGGTAPYTYSYYYKKTNDKNWVVKKANTAETSVSFKPGTVTVYDIKIVAEDSKGAVKEKILTVSCV